MLLPAYGPMRAVVGRGKIGEGQARGTRHEARGARHEARGTKREARGARHETARYGNSTMIYVMKGYAQRFILSQTRKAMHYNDLPLRA